MKRSLIILLALCSLVILVSMKQYVNGTWSTVLIIRRSHIIDFVGQLTCPDGRLTEAVNQLGI
uniref:Uncharacterized protein n=1 Tax=Romanomermis culicivorax TaxID=13658 RepID=A0A915HTE4_ROMCU